MWVTGTWTQDDEDGMEEMDTIALDSIDKLHGEIKVHVRIAEMVQLYYRLWEIIEIVLESGRLA